MKLREAAQAVLDRWDSPAWEWLKQGPTAALMADLRAALAEDALERMSEDERRLGIQMQPVQEPVAHVSYLKSDDETYGWNGNDTA